jgi:hypothetical protein
LVNSVSGLFPCIPWLCHWPGTREAPSTQRMAEAVQAIPWGIKWGDFPQIQRGPPIFVLQIQSVGLPESVGQKTIHQKGRSRASSAERACGFPSFQTGHTARGGITAEKGHSKLISAVFHLSEPGCLPSRVTGFGGAWEVIGGRKRFCQPVAAPVSTRFPRLSALCPRQPSRQAFHTHTQPLSKTRWDS